LAREIRRKPHIHTHTYTHTKSQEWIKISENSVSRGKWFSRKVRVKKQSSKKRKGNCALI
jgi:hypothetical protein